MKWLCEPIYTQVTIFIRNKMHVWKHLLYLWVILNYKYIHICYETSLLLWNTKCDEKFQVHRLRRSGLTIYHMIWNTKYVQKFQLLHEWIKWQGGTSRYQWSSFEEERSGCSTFVLPGFTNICVYNSEIFH